MSYAQFWVVWRENGGTPTLKHHGLPDAIKEAERLVRQFPGARFWILKSQECAEFQAIKWEKAHQEDCACDVCIPF